MLSSPRSPSSTMRILSSAEKCRRVARRISRTTCSTGSRTGPDFCLIFAPVKGYDEPEILPSSIRSICLIGADAGHIDTDYNEESFFVRHAYFLGANDPYKSLKTALRAEIDEDAWETLYRDTSRPFPRPKTGRIAVKVINHFGD